MTKHRQRNLVGIFLTAAAILGGQQAFAGAPGIEERSFVQSGQGAMPRSLQSKLGDVVSVKDFGAACDDVKDDTAAIQQALATVGVNGGTVTVPAGTCKLSAPLKVSKRTTIAGAGRQASKLHFTHNGDGIKSIWPINSSTGVWVTVRDIALVNTSSANGGGGFVDVGGTFVDLSNVFLQGWKYGVIFDQTEIATVDLSEIVSGPGAAGVWLVNGADHTPGAKRLYTNRITISRTQFNAATNASYNIIDDGGGNHSIRDNNFNSGAGALRAAAAAPLLVSGNESEGHQEGDIYLADTTMAGANVGPCTGFQISANQLVSSAGGRNITVQSGNNGTITSNLFGQAAAAIDFIHGNANQSSGIVIEGNSKIVSGNGITPGVFVRGLPRSMRSNIVRQVAHTYSAAAARAGTVTITPATMEYIQLGTRLTLMNSDGTNAEDVVVTAATPTAFTATLAKAKGAKFVIYGATPATQETGNWTPLLAGSNAAGANTYSLQSGQYMRVGNMVIVKGQVAVSAKGTMSGTLLIKGLPFAAENVSNAFSLVSIGLWNGLSISGYQQLSGIILPGDNAIGLRKSGSNVAYATVNATDATGSTLELYFTAVYFTSAL